MKPRVFVPLAACFAVLAVWLTASALAAPAATPPPPSSPPAAPRGAPGGGPPKAPPTAAQKAEEYYKNIQVLQGSPADQLIPAMQFISASLGVDCDFCHVEHEPDKDDKKEKKTAREMVKMTFAINKNSFEGKREVTCNSCHRGTSRPQATPAVATAETPEEGAEAKEAALPTPESVLDKYLKAVGGAEAFAKITTRVQKGKLTGFGPEPFPIEVFSKAPDKRISIVHTPRGDNITAYDGKSGWLGNTGRPPRDMSTAESDAVRIDADLLFPTHVAKLYQKLRVVPGEKIDGHDTLHVVGRNEGQPPLDLWFDAQSGLLLRLARYAETPLGRNPTQIDYQDYRDADGVKIPFRWTLARPSGRFTIQIDEVKQNVPIEDAKFDRTTS